MLNCPGVDRVPKSRLEIAQLAELNVDKFVNGRRLSDGPYGSLYMVVGCCDLGWV